MLQMDYSYDFQGNQESGIYTEKYYSYFEGGTLICQSKDIYRYTCDDQGRMESVTIEMDYFRTEDGSRYTDGEVGDIRRGNCPYIATYHLVYGDYYIYSPQG